MSIDCEGRTTREINQEICRLVDDGVDEILVINPGARHNLGVAVTQPVRLIFDGSVGYYCAGMIDGPTVEVRGSAGWGVGEAMMSGTIIVEKNAGNGAAASIRGGTIVIRGDAAARAGIAMKGGTVIVGGDAGYMTGFMMQKGTIIICGNAGEALGDSLYEGRIFVGGEIAELGNDAVVHEPDVDDLTMIHEVLSQCGITSPRSFKKVIAGRRLWNFDKKELDVWKEAL
jgi:glutamate synthase domain-containing protein 3